MALLVTLIVFCFGVVVGSFFNALVWRLPRHKSICARHSICVHCRHALAWYDLIPVVSFVLLRGRCRYCHKHISWRYPIIEVVTGLVLTLPLAFFGLTTTFVFVALLSAGLELLFLFDYFSSILPDEVTIPCIVLGIVVALLLHRNIMDIALGGILGAGFFWLQYVLSRKKWIGSGDIRLGGVMGVALGVQLLPVALVVAYCSGALVSIVLLLTKKKKMQSHIPFGTFLSASTYIVLLAGAASSAWITTSIFPWIHS